MKELLRQAFEAGKAHVLDWERGSGGNEPDFDEWYANYVLNDLNQKTVNSYFKGLTGYIESKGDKR